MTREALSMNGNQQELKMTEIRSNPDQTMDTIYNQIANGGFLIELCKEWDIPHNRLYGWIMVDKERADRYANAMAMRDEFTMDAFLHELKIQAFANISDAFDKNGTLLPFHEMPENIIKTAEFKRDSRGDITGIALPNKMKALIMLAKYFGLTAPASKSRQEPTLAEIADASWEGNSQSH